MFACAIHIIHNTTLGEYVCKTWKEGDSRETDTPPPKTIHYEGTLVHM